MGNWQMTMTTTACRRWAIIMKVIIRQDCSWLTICAIVSHDWHLGNACVTLRKLCWLMVMGPWRCQPPPCADDVARPFMSHASRAKSGCGTLHISQGYHQFHP